MLNFDTGINLITFASQSPLFKGTSLIVLAIFSLAFGWWFNKGNKESKGFWVYVLAALIILAYGIFILVVRPQWWLPPYMIK